MSHDNQVVVSVRDVTKDFTPNHEKTTSIKSSIVNVFKKSTKQHTTEQLHVLKGVSFDIKRGEFFGIVGRNGGGKSTLLKIIAGIYRPTSGEITINGTLIPFIELGVGFNPELTGRENIYLNGALFGFSKKQIDDMYDEIVDFAELHQFMDQKLKNYSSGMQVRLAFSVAIKAQGDILVLDEVLAVGDEAFQRKCANFFEQIKKDKTKTVILVTHTMENVRKYCSRAMLLSNGEVNLIGNPDVVADEYYGLNLVSPDNHEAQEISSKPKLSAKITSKRLLSPRDTLTMEINYQMPDDREVVAKAYIELNGQAVMATNPVLLGKQEMITKDTEPHTAVYSLNLKDFNKGEYKVIALLEAIETGANIANFGYDSQTVIKIDNPDPSSSGGIFSNQASMDLVK